jgi:hypothetical protein
MTDPATLLALAERCEQAAGPDRELDFTIDDFMLKHGPEADRIRNPRYVLPYTASLDAAVTLVPEGHEWLRKNEICMTVYRVPADLKEWARHIDARGATPALALCAAALRARAAMI